MCWRKYLIAVAAAAAASIGAICPAFADDDGITGLSLSTASNFSATSYSVIDYSTFRQTGDQLAPSLGLSAAASVDATWVGKGSDSNWLNLLNWSQNFIPNGTDDVARFDAMSGGPIAQLNGATITLKQLDLNDPLYSAVVGGTINLVGLARVTADGASFELPNQVFATFGQPNVRAGNNIGGPGTLAATFTGTAGLTKDGDTHLQIDSPQFYSGTTSIIGGGKIISTVGDSAFGVAGNGISLNSGSIQIATTDWTTTRTVDVTASGGAIFWVGANRAINFSGNFTGTGTLTLNGGFGANVGAATIRTANDLSGPLNITGGTVVMTDNGAFAHVPSITNAGTIVLDNSISDSNINRIGNATPITMRGAGMTLNGGTTNYSESIGNVTLDGGFSYLTLNPGTAGAQLNMGNLSRNNGGGMFIRGMNLGGTPGPGSTNVFIANGGSLLATTSGVVPYMWVNPNYDPNDPTRRSPESVDNTLATYGVNGVAPIGFAASDFSSPDINTPVRVSTAGTLTVNSGTMLTIQALILAAPQDFGVVSGSTPRGMTLAGTARIRVDSGVVLSANAGTIGTAGTVNSVYGNIIRNTLDFGSREGIFLTPSALYVLGPIIGTGGITKIGPRTMTFAGANSYTGTTTLTGFNRFVGNVPKEIGGPGSGNPFGNDISAIVIYGGNVNPLDPNTGTFAGTGYGELGCVSSNAGTNFDRDLELRGDNVLLRNFGTGTLTWNGTINVGQDSDPLGSRTILTLLTSPSTGHMVLNGSIGGPGTVVIGSPDPDPSAITYVDMLKPGTFTGGLILAGGTIGIGDDRALGSHIETDINGGTTEIFNTVKVAGTSMMSALGAPRLLKNDFIVYGNTLGIGGTKTIELSGNINARGGDFIANVTNTSTTTFSGQLTGGGMVKQGNGTLVLSGSNLFTGPLNVGSAGTNGGMVIVRSNSALGSTIGATSVFNSSSALALDGVNAANGSLNISGETIYLSGSGVGTLGALRNLSGNNVLDGIVRPAIQYSGAGTASPTIFSQQAAIGVDASTTLTVTRAIQADDPGVVNNVGNVLFLGSVASPDNRPIVGIRKLGTGTLVVGSSLISSTLPNNTLSNWNGAVLTAGSLLTQEGSVRIQSGSGNNTIFGGKSVVDVGAVKFGGTTASPIGQLDLTDNAMVVDYAGTSPLSEIRGFLKTGYKNGLWNGNGIVSSKATTITTMPPNGPPAMRTALGYAEASTVGLTTLYGDPFDSTTVVVQLAYTGDANLDGRVDQTDLGLLATHWNSSAFWSGGDFNYDGVVDVGDLYLMALNWQPAVASGAPSLAAALAAVDLPPLTSIPEPAGLALLGLIGVALVRRRPQRQVAR